MRIYWIVIVDYISYHIYYMIVLHLNSDVLSL